MIDPCSELRPVLAVALRADAALQALFAGGKVRVYDVPPTNVKEPYIVPELATLPASAEFIDGTEVECTFHVWSRMDPPGRTEAEQMIGAICDLLAPGDAEPPALTLASHRVVSANRVRSSVLMDPVATNVAHGVAVVRLATEPL